MPVILEGRKLTKAYGPLTVLRDLSLSVEKGEVLGIVGESGSGKSTLARVLCGLIQPDSGDVYYRGRGIHGPTREIQFVFQDPDSALNPRCTIAESLGRVFDGRKKEPERIVAILDELGLPEDVPGKLPRQLSGGQKQRIVLARALLANPGVLIADEPTASLDSTRQRQALTILGKLVRDHQLTLLLISHDLRVVSFLCDQIAVLETGRIVEMGSRDRVLGEPEHSYTKKLLAAV